MTSKSQPLALLVDDDPQLRNSIARLLAHAGYRTVCAADLSAARVLLDEARPDVLLLDFNLHDEVGTELLEELASRDDAPPTVVVSASPVAETIAARFAVEHLDKPFTLDEVERAITRAQRPTRWVGAEARAQSFYRDLP